MKKIAIVYGEHSNEKIASLLAREIYKEFELYADIVECPLGYDKSRTPFDEQLKLDGRIEEWRNELLKKYKLVVPFHDGSLRKDILFSLLLDIGNEVKGWEIEEDSSPPDVIDGIGEGALFVEVNRDLPLAKVKKKFKEFLIYLIQESKVI